MLEEPANAVSYTYPFLSLPEFSEEPANAVSYTYPFLSLPESSEEPANALLRGGTQAKRWAARWRFTPTCDINGVVGRMPP
ncbi:hypothetical protein PO909_026744 [Leuciscus waleckii]